MKKNRFILPFIALFIIGPLFSMGADACALCANGQMKRAMVGVSCHVAQAPVEAGEPLRFTPACCCSGLVCAEQEERVATPVLAKGITNPALGPAIYTVVKVFTAPLAHPLHPAYALPFDISTLPLYQLHRSFLI